MRIKSFLSASAAALALTCVSPAIQAQNLLVNPGFEADVLSPLTDTYGATGWQAFGNAFTRFQSPHTGDNAIKIFGGSGVFQDFVVTEGTAVHGEVFGLNPSFDPLSGGALGAVNLEFYDASSNLIGSPLSNAFLTAATPTGDSEGGSMPEVYQFATIDGVAPTGAAFVRFVLYSGGGGGAAYFDDALVTIPEPASLALLGLGGLALAARRRRDAC